MAYRHGARKKQLLGVCSHLCQLWIHLLKKLVSNASGMEIVGLLKKRRKNSMMTRIYEIAGERILAQCTGCTYDTFGHIDR